MLAYNVKVLLLSTNDTTDSVSGWNWLETQETSSLEKQQWWIFVQLIKTTYVQWWKVTKYFYSSTVLKYIFEVLYITWAFPFHAT